MRALVSWLQDFVEISEPAEKLAEDLTMAGLAVDGVEQEDGETLLELDITSNRPDALNHYGLAREVAAIYRRPLKAPTIEFPEDGRAASEFASIEIQNAQLCPRYVGRVLLGVEIKPAPDWIRKRLELCGIRSINNIADLTNYVLLELGHPTHAFDLETLNDRKIIVRSASAGEELRTLDGIERKLTADDLVIADAYRPVALAGVMGGLETEISDKTRDVLIEAAWFLPGPIRRTSRRFTMHTEASHRFERGADIEAAPWAADRIAGLLGQLSPGVVLKGRIDAYPAPQERGKIGLRAERIRRMLGAEVPDEEAAEILDRLGFEAERNDGNWSVSLPSHRLDVEREIDLIEEVARIHGMGNIESTLPTIGTPPAPVKQAAEDRAARETVRALGYDEMIAYGFISKAEAERFGSFEAVGLRNPFSELAAVMRTSSVPGMLSAVAHNLNRGESDIKLAEFGRLYRREGDGFAEPPILTLGASGAARSSDLFDKPKELGFHDFKADVVALLERFDVERIEFDDRDTPSYYAEGRAARIRAHAGTIGYFGRIDPAVRADYKIRQPVFVAEILLDKLYAGGLKRPQHRELPKAPAVHRDFSLFVPDGIPFAEIRSAVGTMEDLVAIEPIEVFRGNPAPAGFYGLLLRATWQRLAETFTDEEINGYAATITDGLQRKLGIQQRTS